MAKGVVNEFKKGQRVNVSHRGGTPVPGKVVQIIPGARGAFVEVDHGGEVGTKRYRPVAVSLA